MKRKSTVSNFGSRLAGLRKVRGITQVQLAKKIGVSHRVIAYYEGETDFPPTHLLVPMAKVLKVTTDELLGIKNIEPQLDPENAALWRRFKKIETLPKSDQRAIFHYLNALLKKNDL